MLLFRQQRGEGENGGSLARAAHREIADADHGQPRFGRLHQSFAQPRAPRR